MNDFLRYKLLLGFSTINGREMSTSEISRQIGFNIANPNFQEVLKELEEKEYIKRRKVGNLKFINIVNRRKIWEMVKQTEIFSSFIRGLQANEKMFHVPL